MIATNSTHIHKIVCEELVSKSHEAYTYKWTIKDPDSNKTYFYGGRRHNEYQPNAYMHSSKNAKFLDILSKSKDVTYEVTSVGTHEEAALEEARMLTDSKAKSSEYWFNSTNGLGGKGGKGVGKTLFLDTLTSEMKRLMNGEENLKPDQVGPMGITKGNYSKADLRDIVVIRQQFVQTRSYQFNSSHVSTLAEGFDKKSDPNEWEPIVVLLDAKVIDNKVVYCDKGGVVVISGNHRSRGLVRSTNGVSLNAYNIPHKSWEKLDDKDMRTLSNRFNPNPEKPVLKQDPEAAAAWVLGWCENRGLTKIADDGVTKIPDIKHSLVKKELIEVNNYTQGDFNSVIKECQKKIEKQFIADGDNMLDWADAAMSLDPVLAGTLDHYKTRLIDEGQHTDVYKISGKVLNWGKLSDRIYDKKQCEIKTHHNLLVLVYHATKEDMKECKKGLYKKCKVFSDDFIAGKPDRKIEYMHLPITKSYLQYKSPLKLDYDIVCDKLVEGL